MQQAYAGIMEEHGFGRKTFEFETDAGGNAVVHHIKGRFTDEHYYRSAWSVWDEIDPRFDASKNTYLAAIDISSDTIIGPNGDDVYGLGGYRGSGGGGKALIPTSGPGFTIYVAAHELGHAFGLQHDWRADAQHFPSHTSDWMITSLCATEWLDAHSAFNAARPALNENNRPRIQMLPPHFVSPPNVIRFRFEVTNPDGLHQVQLLTPGDDGFDSLLGCKRVSGNSNSIVEIDTHHLRLNSNSVNFQAIDAHGNISWSLHSAIDVASLLPHAKVVSIPEGGLAAAVGEEIGNTITTHTMLNLTRLEVPNREITDLTGIEHAHNLSRLSLGGAYVDGGLRYSNNNAVSDVSPLSGLSQLTYLDIDNNQLTNVSPLAGLNQLTYLYLGYNRIADVSPLAGLNQLTYLDIDNNQLTNVSPLAGLSKLMHLSLYNNELTDVSPLAGLSQLTYLELGYNTITDVASLAKLTQLKILGLTGNSISDVSPLAPLNLPGTESGITRLYLSSNPLNYASINTHIPAMQAKGIEVQFDNRTPTTLVKISGAAQRGVANTGLPLPFVVEVKDQHNRAFAGVPVTFAITAGGGHPSTTSTMTDLKGRAEAYLTLGRTAGTNTVRVTAAKISQPIQFTATAILLSTPIAIPDANLRAKVAAALGKGPEHYPHRSGYVDVNRANREQR